MSQKHRLEKMGIDGALALGCGVGLTALVLLLGGTPHVALRGLKAPLVALVVGVSACVLCRRPAWRGVQEWWPLALMVALYMQLGPYTQLFHPGVRDAELLAADVRLFGGSPSELMAPLHNPWLTELLALAYASYLILPLAAAAPVYIPTTGGRMRHREAFRAVLTAHVLVLGVGYLGYLLVPARGPRCFLPDAAPLRGALGYYEFALHNWTQMQAVVHDAFPSLHTAAAVLAIVHAWRHRVLFRPLPWLITPPAVLLIISTMYLRMHYAVDVLAGLLLAAAAAWLAPRLAKANKFSHSR